ncbi:hypothetical protein BGZ76_003551, partial [Entomortierella beljakovae]
TGVLERLESKTDTIISSKKAGVITRAAGLKQASLDFHRHLKDIEGSTSNNAEHISKVPAEVQGSILTGKKHSCDQFDEDNSTLQSTSQNPKQSRRGEKSEFLLVGALRWKIIPGYSPPKDGEVHDKLMPGNLKSSADSSLPSTDPDDVSYYTDQELLKSTSKLFTWNYLEGSGRLDSHVDNAWIINDKEVGHDLMEFRDRVVQENGDWQSGELYIPSRGRVSNWWTTRTMEDQIWESLCNAVKDVVPPLPDEALLDDSSPQNRTLKAILTKMADTAQLWNTQIRNEDTYLKSQLGPFLDTFFGKVKYTKSDWTPVQDDTRSSESSQLVPDYATTTQVGEQQLSILLLEGKIARNAGLGQTWDDQTKLGQEMKAAMDSILKLEPDDEVCVIGLLIREPLVEFYTMHVRAEATYVMHKFASSYISPDAMNAFPLVHLMEAFAHAKVKVEKTVAQIRKVKVHASSNPKVLLSWLRPSFRKPKLCQVVDE